MKRVLVTGASGFIGQSLLAALANTGYAIRAATRHTMRFASTNDVVVVPDFTDTVDWAPALDDVQFVVHTAGLAHADARASDQRFDRVNRAATQELAAAAERAGIERFIYISSIRAQVDAFADHEITEVYETKPTDSYGVSKLGGELAVRITAVPFTIFRPVVVYGSPPKGNIAAILRLASTPFPLPFRALNNRRSLLAVENLTAAVLFALGNPKTARQTYVIADPEPITIPDMFSTIREALGRSPRQFSISPKTLELWLRMLGGADVWNRLGRDLVVNPRKLMSAGWAPVVETHEGLFAMAQAYTSPKTARKIASRIKDHSAAHHTR